MFPPPKTYQLKENQIVDSYGFFTLRKDREFYYDVSQDTNTGKLSQYKGIKVKLSLVKSMHYGQILEIDPTDQNPEGRFQKIDYDEFKNRQEKFSKIPHWNQTKREVGIDFFNYLRGFNPIYIQKQKTWIKEIKEGSKVGDYVVSKAHAKTGALKSLDGRDCLFVVTYNKGLKNGFMVIPIQGSTIQTVQMHLVNDEGTVLNHIYTGHDRWLDDLDDFIKSEFQFETKGIGLLDLVCAHLLYWDLEISEGIRDREKVLEKINEKPTLRRVLELNGWPELVIYEFNGISVYDEISDDKIKYFPDSDSLEIDLSEKDCILHLSKEDFENYFDGEILPLDDEDEEFEYGHSTGNVVFFMSKQNEELMNEFLNSCLIELNEVYESLKMKTIVSN